MYRAKHAARLTAGAIARRVTGVAGALALATGLSLAAAGGAGATTLTCTHSINANTPPIGCGGARLAYSAKGTLDLAVLGTGSATGNYWNSPVGFTTESLTDIHQDFTVFAVGGNIHSGPGGLGSYVAMYTPDGVINGFTYTGSGTPLPPATTCPSSGTHSTGQPQIGCDVRVDTNVYCLSVANVNDGPNHALRWHVVLRNCNTNGVFHYGDNTGATSTNYNSVSPSFANHFQVWSPVSGAAGLVLINRSLSNDHPHHWNLGNTPYVLDDRGFGGSGTQALAFPENDGLNQEFTLLGCTDPLRSLSTGYQLCP